MYLFFSQQINEQVVVASICDEPPPLWAVALFHYFTVLTYANSAVNPVLYAFLSENFRKTFVSSLHCQQGMPGAAVFDNGARAGGLGGGQINGGGLYVGRRLAQLGQLLISGVGLRRSSSTTVAGPGLRNRLATANDRLATAAVAVAGDNVEMQRMTDANFLIQQQEPHHPSTTLKRPGRWASAIKQHWFGGVERRHPETDQSVGKGLPGTVVPHLIVDAGVSPTASRRTAAANSAFDLPAKPVKLFLSPIDDFGMTDIERTTTTTRLDGDFLVEID